MKTLQRELQLLQNAHSEKQKRLSDIDLQTKQTTKDRDKRKNTLNLCEDKKLKLKS